MQYESPENCTECVTIDTYQKRMQQRNRWIAAIIIVVPIEVIQIPMLKNDYLNGCSPFCGMVLPAGCNEFGHIHAPGEILCFYVWDTVLALTAQKARASWKWRLSKQLANVLFSDRIVENKLRIAKVPENYDSGGQACCTMIGYPLLPHLLKFTQWQHCQQCWLDCIVWR